MFNVTSDDVFLSIQGHAVSLKVKRMIRLAEDHIVSFFKLKW